MPHPFITAAVAGILFLSAASTPGGRALPIPDNIPIPFSSLPFKFNPWDTFLNLSGCRPGDQNPVIPYLKKYFLRFGYLSGDPKNITDTFDAALSTAVAAFQENFRLDPTGFLDPSTIAVLTSPRCGVPDIVNGTSSMHRSRNDSRKLYDYFPGNPKWPMAKRNLTYSFSTTSVVGSDAVRAVFTRAFGQWSAATPLSFFETGKDDDADIKIGFYKGDHGDGEPFDGPLGTLAHAFSPTDGRFHLDADENWVANGDVSSATSDAAVDLESVAVHEIGHLLGLGHSSVSEAIMYPTIKTRTRKVDLAGDDVRGIQSLYGTNPAYVTGGELPEAAKSSRDSGGAAVAVGPGLAPALVVLLLLLVW